MEKKQKSEFINTIYKSETEYVFADPGLRLIAVFLDVAFIFIITLILGIVAVKLNNNIIGIIAVILFYFGMLIYRVISTALFHKTLGKKILGLKIITDNNSKITWSKALLRETIGKWLSSILMIGYFIILFSTKRQGLHDIIAKTYVVIKKD